MAGDYESAIRESERAFEINPNDYNAVWVLGDAYFETGRIEEALAVYQRLGELNPVMKWQLARAYIILGREDEAHAVIAEIEEDGIGPMEALGLTSVYAYLGDLDRAFEFLHYEDIHTWMPWTRVMIHWEPLWADPRYDVFLRDVLKLPPIADPAT